MNPSANDKVSPARKEFEKWCQPDSPKEFEPGYWRCWQAAWEAACSQPVAPGRSVYQLFKHKPDCTWATPLQTGAGYLGCDCGLDYALLELEDFELAAPPQVSTPPQIAQYAKFDMQTLDAIRMRAEEGHPIHWSDFLYVLHGLKAGAVSAPRCPPVKEIARVIYERAFDCRWAETHGIERDLWLEVGKEVRAQFFHPSSQPSPEVESPFKTSERCMDSSGRTEWHCSLRKGHAGNHRAYESHDLSGEQLDTWPAQPSPEGGSKP